MMNNRWRAAIVGLGRVAWRFDNEPGRKVIWTHLGAYGVLSSQVTVVGACDRASEARDAFSTCYPRISVFEDLRAMITATTPDIVSICTPADSHRAIVEVALSAPSLKVIWCEKPLAASLADAEVIVQSCERRSVALVVSHVRRWSSLWQRFARRTMNGELGTLRHLRVSMPNRLWSIGSHAVDLAIMMGGDVREVVRLDVPALAEDGEPARPALISFASGAYAVIEVSGLKDRLIVEAEATGDRGRLRAREDRGEITFEPFVKSERYVGYFEPGSASVEKAATLTEESPFIAAAQEVVALAGGNSRTVTCSGHDALKTMRVLDLMAA